MAGKIPGGMRKSFESSRFDVEKKGVKEGSPADLKRDKAQMKQMASATCKCGKKLVGGKCPGCKNMPSKCACGKK